MTWITDNSGTRWVEQTPRKRRSPPRQGRFSVIAVDDQLERPDPLYRGSAQTRQAPSLFYVVTDLWFDPVKGQSNEYSGQMVAIQRIGPDGQHLGKKEGFSRHALSTQGFFPASIDYIGLCRGRVAAAASGSVVGISEARRKRHLLRRTL